MQFAAETVWVRYVSSCVYGLCLFIRLMSKGFCSAETFGCCRFVYNWALNLKITAYKERKETLGNVYLTNLMKSEPKAEHEWLSEISSQSLQSALRNPDTAYTDFFRNTHAVGFPRFKSRKDRQSSSVRSIGVWISPKAQLRFPKPKIFQPCPGSNPI